MTGPYHYSKAEEILAEIETETALAIRAQPQSFSVPEVRLLVVLVPGFGLDVCSLSGAVVWWCPVCPGAHRLRLRRAVSPLVSLGLVLLVKRVQAGHRAAASR
jgi:hypothetical protein